MLALNRHVPEFASGALTLRKCKIDLLHLKDTSGEWGRNWSLTVADGDGERSVPVRVTLIAPSASAGDQPQATEPFESSDWQCWLPELRLLFKHGKSKKNKDFASLKILTDAEQAGQLLEQALRAQAPGYQQASIRSCVPEMVHNKPGKSTVIRYKLGYGPEAAGRGWRDTIILKVYGDDTGRNAFTGMRAVWDAGLRNSAAVRVPEPLAYLAEQQATVQGPVPEEHDLEKLLVTLLLSDDPADQQALQQAFRATGMALAAFHSCGGKVGLSTTWNAAFAEAEEQLACLRVPFPAAVAAIDKLVEQLRALEAAIPADPAVPTHGAFRPEQVLIANRQIGFIDFDSFCMAEPAFDIALFRASMMDNGLYSEHIWTHDQAEIETRRTRIDALNESFLAGYEAHAAVSRRRVALWEAIFYLNDSLQCWTKPRPNDPRLVVGLLERHLSTSGLYDASEQNQLPAQPAAPALPAEALPNLRRSGKLPEWLLAPLQADQVSRALRKQVPEFASGALSLRGCKIKRMLLNGSSGRWVGTYNLTVESPDGKRQIALRGTFTPPHLRQPEDVADTSGEALSLGQDGWRMALPALGLELEPEPPETELAAMPQLTDPAESRTLLEQGLRAGSPERADLQIEACVPEVLSYKPGSRCTLRYHLTYPAELAESGWPSSVIAKTYRKDSKGRNAYDGMQALWDSPLAGGAIVALAEPLAYIPELKVMVQAPIAGDQSLEDMLKSALSANSQTAMEQLYGYMRKTAAGLAAFHQSGVRHGDSVTLEQRFAEIHALLARLLIPVPELAGAVEPLLEHLEQLAAAEPADAEVPTHGTFNPEQVLIDGERIGLIDFDDFCMAEPALDVALFRAAIKDIGMNALDESMARQREIRLARLARLDTIAEVFLAEYERHAPISRGRVALWEAWSYLRDALHFWTKVKPAEPDNGLMMLESQLRDMGLYHKPEPAVANQKPRARLPLPSFRYLSLASALVATAWLDDLAELIDKLLTIL
jgi:aminoglycoside phosphotransferase (APT) family kinase protein